MSEPKKQPTLHERWAQEDKDGGYIAVPPSPELAKKLEEINRGGAVKE